MAQTFVFNLYNQRGEVVFSMEDHWVARMIGLV